MNTPVKEGDIFTFELPHFVTLPRKTKDDRKVYLNLNVYRNLHHHINNQIKINFWPKAGYKNFQADHIRITYKVEKKAKRKYDLMNILSVVDKFFLDWIVSEGFIPDDNIEYVSYGAPTGSNGDQIDRITATIEIIRIKGPQQAELI